MFTRDQICSSGSTASTSALLDFFDQRLARGQQSFHDELAVGSFQPRTGIDNREADMQREL